VHVLACAGGSGQGAAGCDRQGPEGPPGPRHIAACRVHQTLRVTPAMEAGLTDHVWTVAELLHLGRLAETASPSLLQVQPPTVSLGKDMEPDA